MAYLIQISSLKKKNTAFRSFRSYNKWNDSIIKTTNNATLHFDGHYNHNGAGIKLKICHSNILCDNV